MQKVICPYCGRVAKYVDSSVIYYGHSYGMAYLCRPCNAYVGVHSGTDRPKGSLANAELRGWRKATHARFDPLWQDGPFKKRNAAYRWLSEQMEEKVLFVAQDIDYTVGLMCYIQLSLMGCAGYVVIGDTLINPCTAYDKKGLLPAGDPERIWFTPLFSDGIWYGRRLAAQMDLLISGSSRKSPENVNSFTEKPEKVADSPAKDTKKPCSFTEPAKAAAPVSTPVSTKKVETWKPAELNGTKNGQLTFF